MPEDKNKTNKLEDINRRLYSRDESLIRRRKERPLSKFSYGVETQWAPSAKASAGQGRRTGISAFKKFFIFSLIVFVGALVFAAFKFGTGSNTFSAENLTFNISVNPFVQSGEETDFGVEIENKNATGIEISNLTVEYQKGQSLEGESGPVSLERKKIDMESIASYSSAFGSTRITLFGDQGSRRNIKVSLEYRTSGSSAIFIKEFLQEVLITSAPITITASLPEEINPGQEISANIKITSNSAAVSKNMLLKVLYPFGFQFKESNPEPFSGDSIWFLGDLAPGAEKTITIKGIVMGDIGEQRIFRILAGEQDKNNQSEIGVLYASTLSTVSLASPSLGIKLIIAGKDQETYAVASQSKVQADINWSNNLPTKMEDLEITAHITGNALNKNSIAPESGLYNHLTDTIIWNKTTIPSLASIGPGDEGTVSFAFTPVSTAGGSLLSNPSIAILVSVRGNKLKDDNSLEPVSNSDRQKTVKIISNLQVSAKALYSDGPIANTGPLPPSAGAETTYTIVWTVTNSNNDVEKAEVRAKLAPFAVKWTGKWEPSGEDVVFNEVTKEIVWRLGRIARSTGIGSDPREVAFQIALEPFFSQVGTTPTLLGETVLTGEDSFAGVMLKNSRGSLNTRISSDSKYKSGDEIVTQ